MTCKLTLALNKKFGSDPSDDPNEMFSTLHCVCEFFWHASNKAMEYDMWGKGVKKLMEHVIGECAKMIEKATTAQEMLSMFEFLFNCQSKNRRNFVGMSPKFHRNVVESSSKFK